MLGPRSVVLDVQGAQNQAHFDRGIPRYVVEHSRAVLAMAPEVVHSASLNPSRPLSGNLLWLLGSGLARWAVPRAQPEPDVAIYHLMSPFELDRSLAELWPAWARRRRVSTVVTLYDLIPLVFQDHYLRDPTARSHYQARSGLVRNADHILAISQASAADAVELLQIDDKRITVVDAGVSSRFTDTFDTDEAAERVLQHRLPRLRPGFMLYVSGVEFRKNNERLISAFGRMPAQVRRAHQLVIACRMTDDARHAFETLARDEGIARDELLMPGYVSDGELAALYRLCRLFVFASFYEGAGLPILEAMAAGTPVAASRTSTTPEILGDLEATFDPHDPSDIAGCLTRIVTDDAALARLRERSARRVAPYTWERVAERTLSAYDATLTATKRRRRPARARIAWISPWPPDESGVAQYNARLVREIARSADVDVFVAGPVTRHPKPMERGVRLLPVHDLDLAAELRAYDAVVYSMGNSSFHKHVYESLMRRRGVVVAHDVRLVGFYGWYAGQERPEDPTARLADRLADAYRGRVDTTEFASRAPLPEEQMAMGLFLTDEIQRQADHLVVHSDFAADILRLDRSTEPRVHAPISVLPLALELRPERPRLDEGDAPVIVSFGVVSEVKGLATLIDAFAALLVSRPGARLVLAGPAPPGELDRWLAYAIEAGVGDQLSIRGFVDDDEYERLLASGTLAVQLRTVTNGEASAAVCDCLGAGMPTIATDLGWVNELPEDVLVRLPAEATPAVLAREIAALLDEPQRRERLAAQARRYAEEHSFRRVAERYLETLGV
jgi:glycosyltransferase involved in cell wall biosynthesis